MNRHIGLALFFALAVLSAVLIRDEGLRAQSSQAPTAEAAKVISAEDCTPARLGTDDSCCRDRRTGSRSHPCRAPVGGRRWCRSRVLLD